MNISFTDSNSEVLKKYEKVSRGITNQIKKINNNKVGKYGKDYLKIKFSSDDYLPLNTVLKFHTLTIIIRNILENDGKYYPEAFLGDCLYEI